MSKLNILKYAAVAAGFVIVGIILGSAGFIDRDFMTIMSVGNVVAFECGDRRVRARSKGVAAIFAGEALCRIFFQNGLHTEIAGILMLVAVVGFVVFAHLYDRGLAETEAVTT